MSPVQDGSVPTRAATPRAPRASTDQDDGSADAGLTAAPIETEPPDAPGRELDGVDAEGIDAALLAGVVAAGEMDRAAGTHVEPEYPLDDVPSEIDVDTIVEADGTPVASVRRGERLDRLATLPDEPAPVAAAAGGADEEGEGADGLYEAVLDEAVVAEDDLDAPPGGAKSRRQPR